MDRRRAWAWPAALAVGLCFAAAYVLLPRGSTADTVFDDAGGFLSAAAIVVGVRWHRPVRRAPWYLFAAAQLCSGLGDVLFTIDAAAGGGDTPSLADVLYLGAYPLFALGLFLLVRSRTPRRDLAAVLDAGIVTAGLGLLSWTFLMRPMAADASLSPAGRAVDLAYPLADILLLGVLARLLTGAGARNRSHQLLTAALLLLLGADAAFAVITTVSSYDGGLVDAVFMLSYTTWGAAALHPGMSTVDRPAPPTPSTLTFRRFSLLGVTTLIAPGILLAQGMTTPESVDWLGIGVGALVLFVLILARVWNLVRQVQDQAVRLDALAHRDSLTGVPNRRSWDVALARALAQASRTGAEVTVAILDLDRFKRFNDRNGHAAGDRLLIEATARWTALLRAGDVLARYGGEEFCLLVHDADPADVVATLRRLREVTPAGQTFSAGVAVWDRAETPQWLLERADGALYEAKRRGRDGIVVAGARTVQPTASRS